MSLKIFKRYERKYILDSIQYENILKVIKEKMILDDYCKKNGVYTIYNIYCDTENSDIIRRSINAKYFKEKLRIRSYKEIKSDNEKVFLELKKKIGGIVSKRRAVLSFSKVKKFLYDKEIPVKDNFIENQVINEIGYFLKLNKAYPRVFIRYDRIAFFEKENRDLRITFDINIRTRRTNLTFVEDIDNEEYILDEDKYLMEIKSTSALPLWLVDTLSKNKIYSTSFSKYGREFKKFCLKDENKSYKYKEEIV